MSFILLLRLSRALWSICVLTHTLRFIFPSYLLVLLFRLFVSFLLLFLDLKLCHITAIRFEIENICTVHVHFFNSLSLSPSLAFVVFSRVIRIKLHLSYSTIVYTSNRIEKREIERDHWQSRYYKLQLPYIFIC